MKRNFFAFIIASLFSIPFVFANTLQDSFQPLFDVLLQVVRIGSFSWLPKNMYGPAVKFVFFLVILVVINGLKPLEKIIPDKKARGVIAFAVAAISVIFMPDGLEMMAGNMYGVIGGMVLLGFIPGYIIWHLFQKFKTLPDGRTKNLAYAILCIFTFVLLSVISSYVGLRTIQANIFTSVWDMITVGFLIASIVFFIRAFIGFSAHSAISGGSTGIFKGLASGLGAIAGATAGGALAGGKLGYSWSKKAQNKIKNVYKKHKEKKEYVKGIKSDFDNITNKFTRLEIRLEKSIHICLRGLKAEVNNSDPDLKKILEKIIKSEELFNKLRTESEELATFIENIPNKINELPESREKNKLQQEFNNLRGLFANKIRTVREFCKELIELKKSFANTSMSVNDRLNVVKNHLPRINEIFNGLANFTIAQSEMKEEISKTLNDFSKVLDDDLKKIEDLKDELKKEVKSDEKVLDDIVNLRSDLDALSETIDKRLKENLDGSSKGNFTKQINSALEKLKQGYVKLFEDISSERDFFSKIKQKGISDPEINQYLENEQTVILNRIRQSNGLKEALSGLFGKVNYYLNNQKDFDSSQKEKEFNEIKNLIKSIDNLLNDMINKDS